MTDETTSRKMLEMIEAVYLDGEAEINGRVYKFCNMTHKQRRRVFAFYSRIAPQADRSDMSFLDTPEFEAVEAVINNAVTYNDSLLSKLGDSHWEKYEEDYILFVSTALGAISYPFFAAARTA